MRAWARKLAAWSQARKQVWAYFNNDIGGFAPANASALQAMLKAHFS